MRRLTFALPIAAALVALSAGGAHAEDLGGRFGLGADTSLGLSRGVDPSLGGSPGGSVFAQSFAVPGLAATFFFTDMLAVQVIAAFQIDDGDLAGETRTVTTLGLAARALLALQMNDDAHLTVFGGVSLASLSQTSDEYMDTDPDQGALRFGFELGLRPEWFVSEHFSIHTQVGVVLSLWDWSRDGDMIDDPPPDWSGWDLDVGASLNLLGNAGFTWWF